MSGENRDLSLENQHIVMYDSKLATLHCNENEVVIKDRDGTVLERFSRNVDSVVMITDYRSLRKAILLGVLPMMIIAFITMALALSQPKLLVPILIIGMISAYVVCITVDKNLRKVYSFHIKVHYRIVVIRFLSYVSAAEFVSKLEFRGKDAFIERYFGPLREML